MRKVQRILVILFWIIGILILILVSTDIAGSISLARSTQEEVELLFNQDLLYSPGRIDIENFTGLPDPVKRWLSYSGIIGKEDMINIRIEQEGVFRTGPKAKWMDFEAVEYFNTSHPSFMWHANMKVAPFVYIGGRDLYFNGVGNMKIKLFSAFTLVDASAVEMDQASLLRYLSEMIWFPAAALKDYIQWEAIDDTSSKAIIIWKGVHAEAIFYFSESGHVTNMLAKRYREINGSFVLNDWSTPIHEYGEFDGIKIPIRGEAIWHLPDGDLSYIQIKVTDFRYNIPGAY